MSLHSSYNINIFIRHICTSPSLTSHTRISHFFILFWEGSRPIRKYFLYASVFALLIFSNLFQCTTQNLGWTKSGTYAKIVSTNQRYSDRHINWLISSGAHQHMSQLTKHAPSNPEVNYGPCFVYPPKTCFGRALDLA